MASSIDRALVLGGGGVTGVAWEIGLLAGLAQAGIKLAEADLVVGTSAGSMVAVHVASGTDLQASMAKQVESPGREVAAKFGVDLIARLAWAAMRARSPTEFGKRMGHIALKAKTLPEVERREIITSRLPASEWPAPLLRITAVDAETGEFRVFTRADDVPMGYAVAASCAVPGVWPPVTIQGRRYIDGGMRSATNADLAAGASRVLVLAPIALGFGVMRSLSSQVDELKRAGSRVVVVSPSSAAKRAIGRNSLDPARRGPAAQAGNAQAREVLAEVRALLETISSPGP